jgi:hypothetical protein
MLVADSSSPDGKTIPCQTQCKLLSNNLFSNNLYLLFPFTPFIEMLYDKKSHRFLIFFLIITF